MINDFWNGKIKLWKSYWIVGELLNALFILLIFNIEVRFLNNRIIVRSMEEYKIKNCLRLSIGNSSENKYLLKVVKKIFKNV